MAQEVTQIEQLARVAKGLLADTVFTGFMMLQTLTPTVVTQREKKTVAAIVARAKKSRCFLHQILEADQGLRFYLEGGGTIGGNVHFMQRAT